MYYVVVDWIVRILAFLFFAAFGSWWIMESYINAKNREWLLTLVSSFASLFFLALGLVVLSNKTDYRKKHEGIIVQCPSCGQDTNINKLKGHR